MDVPVGFTREEGHTGFLCLPFAVLAFIFLARNIQSLFSLVDREVEVCVLMSYNRSPLVGYLFIILFFCEEKSQFVLLCVYVPSCSCSFYFHAFVGAL